MASRSLLVVLEPDPEADPPAVERAARQLRSELDALDVESVSSVAEPDLPAGAKAGDAVSIGALLVAFGASGGVLTVVVQTLLDWLGRRSKGTRIAITIDGETLELDNVSGDQRRQLVEAYLRRHAG